MEKEAGCSLGCHPGPRRALELVRTFPVDSLLTLGRVQGAWVQGGPRVPALDMEGWDWRKGSFPPSDNVAQAHALLLLRGG